MATPMPAEAGLKRLYELDWIRVLAFFLLILIHSAMPFLEFGFPVKNQETSGPLTLIFLRFTYIWRLPLIFLVSGMGVWLAFRKRTSISFFLERTRRILLPLLFSVFLLTPLQGYFREMQKGLEAGNYFEYLIRCAFTEFPPETFHLWFLVNLFAYSLVLIPIVAFLKSELGGRVISFIGKLLTRKAGFFVFAAFYIIADFLAGYLPGSFLASWQENTVYALTMFIGLVLVSRREHLDLLQTHRYFYTLLVVVSFPVYFYVLTEPHLRSLPFLLVTLESISRLAIIFAILVFARRFISKGNSFLKYNTEAVYPYYLIHQTISVALSFYVVQLDLGIAPKLLLILSGTVVTTLLIYHFLIRPFNVIRPLFGMKKRQL